MVSIEKQNTDFVFTVRGLHKLWALTSQLIIPAEHIISAHQDAESLKDWWKGWRFPGTNVPGLITAGTFYIHGDKNFWDVSNIDNSIIIELKDEGYHKLIIEVEDPSAAIALLTK